MYEPLKTSLKERFVKTMIVFLGSVVLAVLYFLFYTVVLGNESPKTAILKKQNAKWVSRVELLNRQMDHYEDILGGLELRNDDIYRSIFGMSEIPEEVRRAGFGGTDRYSQFDMLGSNSLLKSTARRLDVMTKEVYVQSKSFDEVATLSKRAGDMASCIPAIPPIIPDPKEYHLSSPFGYRSDPMSGRTTFHEGVDFATKTGHLVFTTGDGVVESVKFNFFGYGNEILIDHGFGYKTRYAHMSVIYVAEGMKLKRGDCIGESGSSGKSTGPHLHYEVYYKNAPINPANFYDLSMTPKEYSEMVRMRDEQSQEMLRQPFRFKSR